MMSSLFCDNAAPDYAILHPPLSNFVREMFNSRHRLRPLMHPDDAKVMNANLRASLAPQRQPQKTPKAMKAKPKKTMKAMKAKNTKTSMNAMKTQKAMKKKRT